MKKLGLIFLGATLALACGDDEGTTEEADAAVEADATVDADAAAAGSVRYEHPLYDDPEDCPDDPLFNCTPFLILCADGTSNMLVTDIMNTGTYERDTTAITTTWGPGDVPSDIVFAISDGGDVLTDDWQELSWTRVEGGIDSYCD